MQTTADHALRRDRPEIRPARMSWSILAAGLGSWFLLAAAGSAAERSGSTYVPGSLGDFNLGVVATNAGFFVRNDMFYYEGTDARAVRNGQVNMDLQMSAWVDSVKLTLVPGWTLLGARYAAALNFAVANAHVTGDVRTQNEDGTLSAEWRSGTKTALADIFVTPLALGWKVGPIHVAWAEMVTIPSGSYNRDDFVNISRNYWALDSQLAATWRHPVYGQEVSLKGGYILNTRNHATDYLTGQEIHVDGLLAQQLGKTLSLGAVWYYYEQVTADSGTGALLGDFQGEAFGAGPAVRVMLPLGPRTISIIGKWLHEFYTRDRFQGDYLYLCAATRF